ncbi:MAG TPA: serine/threonine-protein kinase [Myxococcaceae bacterium]|jgi:predicted Ser/Thr protein kinase
MAKVRTPALNASNLPIGAQVGTWRVMSWRGRGTYGAVYRACEIGREAAGPVALKMAVHPKDPRFAREVALLSRIRHPNVPGLRAHGQWQDTESVHPYLVMQWIEGVPLYDWAKVRNPTSREIMRLLAQAARALEATHQAEGVHRDVKGDNILVRADGQVFLVDFGSSTHAGASVLTPEPLPPGTPTYRSPEAWQHALKQGHLANAHYAAKPSDDVFALGVTAYRLVTDEYPPPTDPGLKESRLWYTDKRSPRPPLALNARVYPRLSALILRMLSLQPEKRGAARELAELLEQCTQNAGPQADQPLFAWETLERSAWSREDAAAASELGHRPRYREMAVVRAAQKRDAAERSAEERAIQGWMAAAAAILIALGLCGIVGQWIHERFPVVAQAENEDAGTGDGGVADLAHEALSAYVRKDAFLHGRPSISVDVPPKPLEGQRRTDSNGQCRRRGEFPINGGCWFQFKDVEPPCDTGQYEWMGNCYQPAFITPRPPTSNPPREYRNEH